MRVLVAEDDAVSRRVLEKLLTDWGYEVVSTKNGHEAWEQAESSDAPHLLLLDWMMPGMDGVDISRQLRRQQRSIHPYILLLTGKDQKQDLVQGFDAGADDYVTKPFDPDELRVRLRAGERMVNLQIESMVALESLRKQATHDSLTGILNRGAILHELAREFDRSPRRNQPVGVVMADLDHFKQINDDYGHTVGDYVLVETAKSMASVVRSYESIGRYGGEEFLIVLSGCGTAGTQQMAERLRQALASREFSYAGNRISVTASFGAASSEDARCTDQKMLIEAADAALYRSKEGGRNRVTCAESQDLAKARVA